MTESDWEEIGRGPSISPNNGDWEEIGRGSADPNITTIKIGGPTTEELVNSDNVAPWQQASRVGLGGLSTLLGGLTFGLGDEAIAGGTAALDSLLPQMLGGTGESLSNAYDRRLNEVRGYEQAFKNESPTTSAVEGIGGSLLVPWKALTSAAEAPTLLQKLGAAASEGAAIGGLYGFGSAQGSAEDRLKSLGENAVIGGLIGPAITGAVEGAQGLGRGASSLYDTLSTALSPTKRLGKAQEEATQAASSLLKSIVADPKKAVAAIDKGTDSFLAPSTIRTAELTQEPALSMLEQTLRRTDIPLDVQIQGQNAAREDARAAFFRKQTPRFYTDEQAGNIVRSGLEKNYQAQKDAVKKAADIAMPETSPYSPEFALTENGTKFSIRKAVGENFRPTEDIAKLGIRGEQQPLKLVSSNGKFSVTGATSTPTMQEEVKLGIRNNPFELVKQEPTFSVRSVNADASKINEGKIPTSGIKKAIKNEVEKGFASGARKMDSNLQSIISDIYQFPDYVPLRVVQDYASVLKEHAAGAGPTATTEARMQAKIAGSLLDPIDGAINKAVKKGSLSAEQKTAYDAMKSLRREQGATFETGSVGPLLKKEPYNARYSIDSSEVTKRAIKTPEDARQLVTALKGQSDSKEALASSLLSHIWDKSTNASTGKLIPNSFNRQLSILSDVAPEVLNKNQFEALKKIGADLTSETTSRGTAYNASAGQSITSQATSLIDLLQGQLTDKALNSISSVNPILGGAVKALRTYIKDPTLQKQILNQELAKAVLDPQAAKALLTMPDKVLAEPIVSKLGNELARRVITIGESARGEQFQQKPKQPKRKGLFSPPQDLGSDLGQWGGDSGASLPKQNSATGPDLSRLMKALVKIESNGNPKATSPKGAQGLTQLMPATGREMAKKVGVKYDPYDKNQNLLLGTLYYKEQLDKFGTPELAYASYNAGPGRVEKLLNKYGADYSAIEPHLPNETRDYVVKAFKALNSMA